MNEIVRLLGLNFADLDTSAAAAKLNARPANEPFDYVVTPNSDHLVRLHHRPELLPLYNNAMLCLLDSRVVATMARRFGLIAPRVAIGSDLTALLFNECLHLGEQVTIIGLRPDWLPDLVRQCRLTTTPAHFYPPFGFDDNPTQMAETVQFVLDHPARFVFLAVGSPRQEKLASAIAATGKATGTGLCIGASLDFLSGHARRAPRWVQSISMEWLFRLLTTPRLAKRYLIDCPAIVPMLLRERRATKNRPSGESRG